MGKNQSASNLTNIIRQDASGNITFLSGSKTLAVMSNTGQVSGSVPALSASYAATSSYATNFNVSGTITATTLVVQTITSSVSLITGSTKFGIIDSNTHQFTGSIYTSGSGIGVGTSTLDSSGNLYTNITVDSATYSRYALQSSGTAKGRFQFDGTNVSLLATTTGGKLQLQTAGANNMEFWTNDTLRMTISSSGNIGIGTSSPVSLGASYTTLEIKGQSGLYGGAMQLTSANGTNKGRVYIANDTFWIGTQNSLPLGFITADTERMRITSDGKVGINTGSPQYLFHVAGGRANLPYICSNQFIAGQISGNLSAANAPNFILMFNMTDDQAGWSCAGTMNAAAWDCWNISTIWVRKLNASFTVNAGITGLYKSGCDFAICDITYNSKRWIAFRYTSNPEIDVMLTGYGLNTQFNSDGTAQVVYSGVTVNTILASY